MHIKERSKLGQISFQAESTEMCEGKCHPTESQREESALSLELKSKTFIPQNKI